MLQQMQTKPTCKQEEVPWTLSEACQQKMLRWDSGGLQTVIPGCQGDWRGFASESLSNFV
jgi:hypothetical protein